LKDIWHYTSDCVELYHIYLWRKVFVLFVLMRSIEPSHCVLVLFQKLLRRRAASACFHGVWTCGVEVLEYSMISSLKIKLNPSWKFRRNWNVSLMLLERSWWARFNEIYLVWFGFRMWEILICKQFLLLKIEINSKKPGFGWKKSVEIVVTLEGLPFNSNMISFHIRLFKKLIQTLQNNVHMLSFPIL
jgi:hypothetical protein